MKKFLFAAVFAVLVLCTQSACCRDDLSGMDVKVDGDLKTTFSAGSGGSGMYSRGRTGISF